MSPRRVPPLDGVADDYVRLALALQRHDPRCVDAFAGPRAWARSARRGRPIPLPALEERAGALLAAARACDPSDRRDFLERQIAAVAWHARRLAGGRPGWDAELRGLFDLTPERFDRAGARRMAGRIDVLLPGRGSVEARRRRLGMALRIAPSRLGRVLRALLDETRRLTAALVPLPPGEAVRLRLVRARPWAAYSWYLGDGRSRIDVNVDQVAGLVSLLETMAHESYPGHHLYNTVRDRILVRGRGWREHSVEVVFSPHTVLSEGVASAARSLLLSDAGAVALLRDVLAPIAGVSRQAVEDAAVLASDGLRTHQMRVGVEAMRRRVEEGLSRREAVAFGARYAVPRAFMTISLRFGEAYGTHMAVYPAGKDLVLRFVGSGRHRAARFRALLETPFTPSALARRPAATR